MKLTERAGWGAGMPGSDVIRKIPWFQIVLPIVVLVAIFGWFLPHLVDYAEVWAAISSLEWQVVLLLSMMGVAASFLEGSLYTVLIPGLGLLNGWKAFLGGNTIAGFAPNPFDIVVRFAMYQGFGVKATDAGASIIIGGSAQSIYSVFAPILALAVFVATGHGTDTLRIFTEVAIFAAIAVVILIVLVLGRKPIAAWLGRLCQRASDWLLPRFGRPSPGDIEELVVDFRGLIVHAIAHRWWQTLSFMTGAHVVKYLGMLLLFRQVGIGADEVSAPELLGVYAIGLFVALMPIVPSGVGVTEAAYIWILARDDAALADLVAAATFSHRVFFWLLPIAIGVIPLVRWMRSDHAPVDADDGLDIRALLDAESGDDADTTGQAPQAL